MGITGKRAVLVADEDEAFLITLNEAFSSKGYDVVTSVTSADALNRVKLKFFDAALLSINLRDMDGLQLLKEIHNYSPKTLNIMVTGYLSLSNASASLSLGAVSYVLRPVNTVELCHYIEYKLDKREMEEKSTRVIDDVLPDFFDLLSEGYWKSVDSVAKSLGVSREMVEKICVVCARSGLVKYRQNIKLVKIGKPSEIRESTQMLYA